MTSNADINRDVMCLWLSPTRRGEGGGENRFLEDLRGASVDPGGGGKLF